MANEYGNYLHIFYANETLIWLTKALGMSERVHVGFDAERRTRNEGQVVSISRPGTFTATEGAFVVQDLQTGSVDITVDKKPEVNFTVDDTDLAYMGERIVRDHIQPAANALADHLDQSLAGLYTDIPWVVDYAALTDHEIITLMKRTAFDNKVPMRDNNLHMQVDGLLQMQFENSQTFHSAQVTGPGQNDILFNGTLGRRFQTELFANQNAPTHIPGTANQAAGGSVGAIDMAAGLLRNAESMVVDGFTLAETIAKGDTFTIAGHTQRYAVTADMTLSSGAGTIAFTPPAVTDYADDAVVTFTKQTDAGSVQQLMFHRNAFAFVSAPLPTELPGIEVGVATDPVTGLSVRASRWAEGKEKKSYISLDMLYGVKTLDPNLAVRGWT